MAKLFYKTKRHYTQQEGEIFTEPSQTIQGETYTMKELLQRYQLGQHIAEKVPIFFDVNDIDEINRFRRTDLDFTDIDEFGRHVENLQQAYDNAIAKQKQEATTSPETPLEATIVDESED